MPWTPQDADPWQINSDPERHYRWISSKPEKLGQWLRSFSGRPGYALVRGATVDATKKMAEKVGLSGEMVDVNLNRIMNGHNVLASIPMEEYNNRRKELSKLTEENISAAKEAYHASAERLPGVTTFERTDEEHEDRKSFANRPDRPISGQSGRGASPHLRPRAGAR